MPADYATIRDENIARYGWDTAVLDLLGHLYSERTHFLYELIQNAEDAGATELSFELSAGRLEVSHDGRPFTEDDVRGICGVARSTKSAALTTIGQFGIGFKAVYAYTRTPRVYSGGEAFRIDNYVRPAAVERLDQAGLGTRFVFPFDLDSVTRRCAPGPATTARSSTDAGTPAPATVSRAMLRRNSRIRGWSAASAAPISAVATSAGTLSRSNGNTKRVPRPG